ncbi:sensor histidine kinase [Mycoplasmatota bacterium]|nr:sensor histidine kinase [Mycoplasmatota bacterium]
MRDISMHVLDIVMNSIHAKASLIEITITEKKETLTLVIKDNGSGMTKGMLENVKDPFCTTRKTRHVGLGIPLLYQNVKNTGGVFNITSNINEGTIIEAIFNKNHIDCIPLGNMNETILSLIALEPDIDFIYTRIKNQNQYVLNTQEIKGVLRGVSINEPEVINWLKEDLLQQ